MMDRLKACIEWWRQQSLGTRCVGVLLFVLGAGCLVVLTSLDLPWAGKAAKNAASAQNWRVKDFAEVYSWWAALFNLGLLTVTLGCLPWLNGDLRKVHRPTGGDPWGRMPHWFWVGLSAVLVMSALWRVPRLDHSFHNDEEYAFRNYSWGKWEASQTGEGSKDLVFEPHSRVEKLFRNKTGNNHIMHTVEANAGLSIWRLLHGTGEGEFSESFVRLFPFLSGLGTIAMAGIVGAMIGGPACGLATALLLALSPWHIRYSVEARGYSTMLFAMMVCLGCLYRALDTGRWAYWLGFGLAQAIYLLSFAASIYVAAAMNLALVLMFALQYRSQLGSTMQIGRWGVSSVISAVVFIQVMLPSVPQIIAYRMRTGDSRNRLINVDWLKDYWSHLVAGIPPVTPFASEADGLGIDVLSNELPWAWVGVFCIAPLLAAIGTGWAVVRGGVRGRLFVFPLWGGAMLALIHNGVERSEMYGWYLIYTAPVFAFGLAAAAIGLARWSGAVRALVLVLTIVGYGWLTGAPRTAMAAVERQPMRSVVETVRGSVGPQASRISEPVWTATFGACDRQILSYDPQVRIIEHPKELRGLMRQAQSASQKLYVYYCGKQETILRDPELVSMVADVNDFEHVAKIKGFEAFMSYDVFLMRIAK